MGSEMRASDAGASARNLRTQRTSFAIRCSLFAIRRRAAFSLVELMIGIIILGLGMVMVATIFPVAWGRARDLSEYTKQRAAASSAHATLQGLVRVARPSPQGDPIDDASSFLGDFVVDRATTFNTGQVVVVSSCPFSYAQIGDTAVHALNLQNIQVQDRRFVAEDPWMLEAPQLALTLMSFPPAMVEDSFFRPRLWFHQRIHPPMGTRGNVDPQGVFSDDDDQWDAELDTKRFAIGVLHRLRQKVEYNAADPASVDPALASTRTFDVYYVSLRRPNPTNRYAQQDSRANIIPDPCDLTGNIPVQPKAKGKRYDVMFPVPWRVQVEFPTGLATRASPTGRAVEIYAPPRLMPGSSKVKAMVAGMFPKGTQFVDEITGDVYRVLKHRRIGSDEEQAILTLDQEVFVEGLDLPGGDPRCNQPYCTVGVLDDEERIRTVWVYPPPIEARVAENDRPVFTGVTPVVGIDIETLTLMPRR